MAGILPALAALLAILAIGALLRRTGRLPATTPDILNALVLDVTLPALVLQALVRQSPSTSVVAPAVVNLVAVVAGLVVSVLAGKLAGLTRAGQGALGVTVAFSNTAFMGLPLVGMTWGPDSVEASTAVFIDATATTVGLWTVGLAFAQRMGSGGSANAVSSARRLASMPVTWATLLGILLGAIEIPLPDAIHAVLRLLAGATAPLVFLSLGMRLDVSVLRQPVVPLLLGLLLRMVVMPALVLGVLVVAGVRGGPAQVSVLQAAMPSALVGVILVTSTGCDARLASGVAVLTTLATPFFLPLWLAAARSLL